MRQYIYIKYHRITIHEYTDNVTEKIQKAYNQNEKNKIDAGHIRVFRKY